MTAFYCSQKYTGESNQYRLSLSLNCRVSIDIGGELLTTNLMMRLACVHLLAGRAYRDITWRGVQGGYILRLAYRSRFSYQDNALITVGFF
jgi:hypothetical protein